MARHMAPTHRRWHYSNTPVRHYSVLQFRITCRACFENQSAPKDWKWLLLRFYRNRCYGHRRISQHFIGDTAEPVIAFLAMAGHYYQVDAFFFDQI